MSRRVTSGAEWERWVTLVLETLYMFFSQLSRGLFFFWGRDGNRSSKWVHKKRAAMPKRERYYRAEPLGEGELSLLLCC